MRREPSPLGAAGNVGTSWSTRLTYRAFRLLGAGSKNIAPSIGPLRLGVVVSQARFQIQTDAMEFHDGACFIKDLFLKHGEAEK